MVFADVVVLSTSGEVALFMGGVVIGWIAGVVSALILGYRYEKRARAKFLAALLAQKRRHTHGDTHPR